MKIKSIHSIFRTLRNRKPSIFEHFLITVVLFLSVYLLGFSAQQSDFNLIFSGYSLLFLSYLWILLIQKSKKELSYYISISVVLRIVLLFSIPHLSDDVFRFIWDGRLWVNQIHPFTYLPSEITRQVISLNGLDEEIFNLLNSPDYYTVYPPVCQFFFYLASVLAQNVLWLNVLFLKLPVFFFELGTLILIRKILLFHRLNTSRILLYALNPLILIEISGNLHYEGMMIFFLLLSYWLIITEKKSAAAITFALSISVKLLPLMFLPFIIKYFNKKDNILFFTVLGFSLLFLFMPLFNGLELLHFADSIDLYFQKFEFNASVYYLFRWIGLRLSGFNLIQFTGPVLAFITLAGILYMAKRAQLDKSIHIFRYWTWSFTLYLLLATTVHPWYLSLLIVFAVFTGFRFPLIWSFLIILTYINYYLPEYRENLIVVSLEYILVGILMLLELKQIPLKSIHFF